MEIFEWTEQTPVTANNLNEMQNILNNNIEQTDYVIEKKGNYVYKKYYNGLVEIYQLSDAKIDLVTNYHGTKLYYGNINFTLPEALTALYSINVSVADTDETALLGYNYRARPNLTGYKLFIYDFGYSRTSKDVTIYTHIVGKWK